MDSAAEGWVDILMRQKEFVVRPRPPGDESWFMDVDVPSEVHLHSWRLVYNSPQDTNFGCKLGVQGRPILPPI